MVKQDHDRWLYLTGSDLFVIAKDRAIKPTRTDVFPNGKPFEMFSTRREWDPIIRPRHRRADGTIESLSVREVDRAAAGAFRLKVSASILMRQWKELKTSNEILPTIWKAIEQTASERNSYKNDWWFTFETIDITDVIEIEKYDHKTDTWVHEPLSGAAFENTVMETLDGARLLFEQDLVVPGVMLIYSAIDTLAWASMPSYVGRTTQAIFKNWVNDFLLPTPDLQCTADDLYGARCGLLHTRTTDSTVAGARRIMYSWKKRTADSLQAVLDKCGPPIAVAVKAETLLGEVERAFRQFLIAIAKDAEQACIVRYKASLMLPTKEAAFRFVDALDSAGLTTPPT